jgi:hypothetical protein
MYLMITYLFIHIAHLCNVFPEVLKQIYQNAKNLLVYRYYVCLPGNNVLSFPQPSNNANGFEHFILNGLKIIYFPIPSKTQQFRTEHYKKLNVMFVCYKHVHNSRPYIVCFH